MSLAVPLSLKRKVEQAAQKRGWSNSNEVAHRLEMSFSQDATADAVLRKVRADLGARGGLPPRAPKEDKK